MESEYLLLNKDSYKVINELHDIEFDHIITDPPYNIARDNNFHSMNRSSIDFGEWDKGADILTWITPYMHRLKPGGSVIIFNDWKNLGDICSELTRAGMEVKDCIRWVKTNPMPRNRDRRYVSDAEYAIWAVKPGGG